MSIQSNKRDFEKAIEELNELIPVLDCCIGVDSGMIATLNSVVDEYRVHFQCDIEEMIDSNEEMKQELEEWEISKNITHLIIGAHQ